ncbi:Uma2 family endonuclease [Lyngbya sp. CCY1209]|uniref:Uma2 family endonuclease n=1 Tax=Lyngbya sp. CCY1209 TaxID=2886103 RepID=UPI002D20AFC8|nr:Uma2 family endonuclease [Lyngbya sp. CCY1209]MEB3886573.1 Uma2 family endonuclease [Lyngbya sp. CCY1209]
MVSQLSSDTQTQITYPERDGNPLSDNTLQFRWITVIQYNLDWLFAPDPEVFVAGDLLWYPVEGDNKTRQAPDVMVAFGVPKGERGSYQQWKEANIAPQVVFEILSPGNTLTEMNKKQVFYDRHGVEEYYLFDPQKNDLSGWLRSGERLDVIDDMNNWVSPRLQIRFNLSEDELKIYGPDNQPFASYIEVRQRLQEMEQQLEQTSEQLKQTSEQLEEERRRADRLAELLRSAGIDPDREN